MSYPRPTLTKLREGFVTQNHTSKMKRMPASDGEEKLPKTRNPQAGTWGCDYDSLVCLLENIGVQPVAYPEAGVFDEFVENGADNGDEVSALRLKKRAEETGYP